MAALPTVLLMHPTLVARPFHRDGWIYEEKVDGWRMVALKGKGTVRPVSRKGHDLTARFPALVKALSGLEPTAFLLDGEVAVYDGAFISRFEWVRRRPKDQLATPPYRAGFNRRQSGRGGLRGGERDQEPTSEGRALLTAE